MFLLTDNSFNIHVNESCQCSNTSHLMLTQQIIRLKHENQVLLTKIHRTSDNILNIEHNASISNHTNAFIDNLLIKYNNTDNKSMLNLLSSDIYEFNSSSPYISDTYKIRLDSFGYDHSVSYIWYDNISSSILYCVGCNNRLGNIMSQYFLAQSIAFFMGFKFKMVHPSDYIKYECSKHYMSRSLKYFHHSTPDPLFSSYLPKEIDFSCYNLNYFANQYNMNVSISLQNKIKTWIYNIISSANQYKGYYERSLPYRNYLRLLYYNPIFYHNFIGNEIHFAFSELEKHSKYHHATQFQPNIDIVIHYRCGDILTYGTTQHGLLSLKYYKQLFYHHIELSPETNVFFITQLTAKTATLAGDKNIRGCNDIIIKLINKIKPMIEPSKLILIGNGSINDDIYKMMNAKILICSPSTFCEMGAFGNVDGITYFPLIGPWNQYPHFWWNKFNKWHAENHRFIPVIQGDTYLSSKSITPMNASQIIKLLLK